VARPNIEWNERGSTSANARRLLPEFVAGYFAEVRDFLSKDREPAEFHRIRLASKRLRYTLELFRPCYSAGLEDRLSDLKDLQDSLGELNDAVATRALLRHEIGHKERKFLKARAAGRAEHFRRHWSEIFDAPGREAWWTDFLRRPK